MAPLTVPNSTLGSLPMRGTPVAVDVVVVVVAVVEVVEFDADVFFQKKNIQSE